MTPAIDPVFGWIARLSLAILFAAAALHKARDVRAFATTVRNYRILPAALAPIAAPVVIAAELALAGALVSGVADGIASGAALALLAVYSAAIAVNLLRGRRDIDCGCLGPARRQPLSLWLLVRNGIVGLAPLLLLLERTPRPWIWIDAVSIAGAVLILSLLWHAAHRLGPAAAAGAQRRLS